MTLDFRAFLLRVADQSIEEIKQKRAAQGRRWVWPTIFILLALSIFIIRKFTQRGYEFDVDWLCFPANQGLSLLANHKSSSKYPFENPNLHMLALGLARINSRHVKNHCRTQMNLLVEENYYFL